MFKKRAKLLFHLLLHDLVREGVMKQCLMCIILRLMDLRWIKMDSREKRSERC